MRFCWSFNSRTTLPGEPITSEPSGISLPSAIRGLAFSIFSVVWHWNDYFWPLLVINSPHLATPPLGTMFFRNEEAGSAFGPLMAGTVLITAPLVLLFVVAQKRFIEGVTLTGVKG